MPAMRRSIVVLILGGLLVATRATPVVIAMHRYTGTPAAMEPFSGLSAEADRQGFIVVYPAGLRNAWDLSVGNSVDIRFLRALIASLRTRANVDRRPVYATGHSMGGAMSARVACSSGVSSRAIRYRRAAAATRSRVCSPSRRHAPWPACADA